MSVASENSRLENARNEIRQKMVNAGLATGTEKLDELATLLRFDGSGGNMNYIITPLLENNTAMEIVGIIIDNGEFCKCYPFVKNTNTARVFPKALADAKYFRRNLSFSSNNISISGGAFSASSALADISLNSIYDSIIYIPDRSETEDEVREYTSGSGVYASITYRTNGDVVFRVFDGARFHIQPAVANDYTGFYIEGVSSSAFAMCSGDVTDTIHIVADNGRTIDAVHDFGKGSSGSNGNRSFFSIVNDSDPNASFYNLSVTVSGDYVETLKFFGW